MRMLKLTNENKILKGKTKLEGLMGRGICFLQKEQMMDRHYWKEFVRQFVWRQDSKDECWRCEFWGKMMRGACFIYYGTQDPELYDILQETVEDLLKTQDIFGRISSYQVNEEFRGWDVWGRKYVLLGLIYFYQICKSEELKESILNSLQAQADYIVNKIGDGEGQINILETSLIPELQGINVSSIMEPFVLLYGMTQKEDYLKFSEYIMKKGGTAIGNMFEMAYVNVRHPYEYPIMKAYEMMSCFEGLLAYHCVTGEEKTLKTVIQFVDRLIEDEFTVIGGMGCRHEYFNYSVARQTQQAEQVILETCVTVTFMKLCSELLNITGESKYAECIERAGFNAYLGAFNTQRQNMRHLEENAGYFPVDSYSPLVKEHRGLQVGGLQNLNNFENFGCCVAIAAAGGGVYANNAFYKADDALYLNFYEDGTSILDTNEGKILVGLQTTYPLTGDGVIVLQTEKEQNLTLKLRIPASVKSYKILLNSSVVKTKAVNGYVTIYIENCKQATISFHFLLSVERKQINGKFYFQYGELILAEDERLDKEIGTKMLGTEYKVEPLEVDFEHNYAVKVTDQYGTTISLIDYMSAGKEWNGDNKYVNVFIAPRL